MKRSSTSHPRTTYVTTPNPAYYISDSSAAGIEKPNAGGRTSAGGTK
ncbi:MAG: hypothetical protein IJP46_06250 [Prevotella sp.]|nr:hypothetical protein [Prevotella sp.]